MNMITCIASAPRVQYYASISEAVKEMPKYCADGFHLKHEHRLQGRERGRGK